LNIWELGFLTEIHPAARVRSHFLPPQSPQMNRIEEEWLHLKRHELSAQLFEDEYDLASALIQAIAERAQRQGYLVERFEFNSG
jgi:putative transposase